MTEIGEEIPFDNLHLKGSKNKMFPQVPLADVRASTQLLHRSSGEGLMCSGFEPQRHSNMVLGRPVQAQQASRSVCPSVLVSSPPSPSFP